MAKIYISYSYADKVIALQLVKRLRDFGQDVILDTEELTPGVEWRNKLTNALKEADGIIAIITENSLNSQFVLTEIGQARAYIDNKFLIPIIFGELQIPLILQDIQCLIADPNDMESVVNKTIKAINSYETKRKVEVEKKEKENNERIQKIEKNALKYVTEATDNLRKREIRDRWISNFWYIAGFACLFIGAFLGYYSISDYLTKTTVEWPLVAILTLKTVVVIGLLIACSKYSFTLGKSYVTEALKNADRIHAIAFGKFYLDAYGANIKWEELKEAFQYWNISNDNTFSKLDTNQFDPKFAEMIIALSKAATSKVEKK